MSTGIHSPTHDSRFINSVLREPEIGFPEIIQYLSGAVATVRCQHYAGARIGVACDPGTMDGKQHK